MNVGKIVSYFSGGAPKRTASTAKRAVREFKTPAAQIAVGTFPACANPFQWVVKSLENIKYMPKEQQPKAFLRLLTDVNNWLVKNVQELGKTSPIKKQMPYGVHLKNGAYTDKRAGSILGEYSDKGIRIYLFSHFSHSMGEFKHKGFTCSVPITEECPSAMAIMNRCELHINDRRINIIAKQQDSRTDYITAGYDCGQKHFHNDNYYIRKRS